LLKVLFIAGFGPIASEVEESRRLYADALIGPEGLLVGVTITPWLREGKG